VSSCGDPDYQGCGPSIEEMEKKFATQLSDEGRKILAKERKHRVAERARFMETRDWHTRDIRVTIRVLVHAYGAPVIIAEIAEMIHTLADLALEGDNEETNETRRQLHGLVKLLHGAETMVSGVHSQIAER
jgi:hypothetical protein